MFKICNRPRAADFETRLATTEDAIIRAMRAVPASPELDAAEREFAAISATIADLVPLRDAAERSRVSRFSDAERSEIQELDSRLNVARAELGKAAKRVQDAKREAADTEALTEPLSSIREMLTDGLRNLDRVIELLELSQPVAARGSDVAQQRFSAAHRELSGGVRLLRQVFNRAVA